jgi:hypothetical protein
VLADRGYYNGDEVLACEGTGVLPYVPKVQTSGNTSRGLFTGQVFIYDAAHDHYTCLASQHLTSKLWVYFPEVPRSVVCRRSSRLSAFVSAVPKRSTFSQRALQELSSMMYLSV